ncbi:MAG TPA: type II toxin-antitoxin system VapC family toxin [Candidatus Sulfotelmatobacter sp.]|jgi:PIN domain nuclease of toxin-antitoxin system
MPLVLDTHAIIWFLSGSSQLSARARSAIENVERDDDGIFVSAISLVEIIYLCEKGRLPAEAWERLKAALEDPAGNVVVVPLDAAVARAVQEVNRGEVPDMPDRIIAATAASLKAELVTRDRRLQSSGVRTLW